MVCVRSQPPPHFDTQIPSIGVNIVMTTNANTNTNTTTTSFVGILDLKKDAVIGVDGQTIVLRTDDFVGISGWDTSDFHLLSVRPTPASHLSVGFLLFRTEGSATDADAEAAPATCFVRRYDPQTEEVSSIAVDDLTTNHLLQQVYHRRGATPHPLLPPTSVIDYSNIVPSIQKESWKEQTKYILSSGILSQRHLRSGDKILPGSYRDDDDDNHHHHHHHDERLSVKTRENSDGSSVQYPNIPVIDVSILSSSVSSSGVRPTTHRGTRKYLKHLSPADRTQLFLRDTPTKIASTLLQNVLSLYYRMKWTCLLGDLQLAYTLFLYLQCLTSLEHWKDLVAMLSLVDPSGIRANSELYIALLEVLPSQISTMDQGFLEDVDEAGNNFLLPSLKRLCKNMARAHIVDAQRLLEFERLLSNKFPSMMLWEADDDDDDETGDDDDVERRSGSDDDGEGDDDDDAPIVVDMEEVEASLARSTNVGMSGVRRGHSTHVPFEVVNQYPLLVAAIQPHEDILMTCARVLDEKKDVSLVRVAAAYLEDFEEANVIK